jgi:acyl-CoA synthetase (NDP forming)
VWLLFDGTAWVSQPSRLSPAVGRPLAWTTSALLGQQPMTQRRPRRRRRLAQEPVFGPLVVFGSGGAATGVLGDHVTRLTPLTDADADADEMIHAVRAAPLLSGDRGVPPVDTAALADALLRISRLADDLPEIGELDLNPVVAREDGVWCVDVRVRIRPAHPRDPFLRRLR